MNTQRATSSQPQTQTFDQLVEEILAQRKGKPDAVAALFATTLARESGTGHYRRVWLLSIDGLTREQHDAICRLPG